MSEGKRRRARGSLRRRAHGPLSLNCSGSLRLLAEACSRFGDQGGTPRARRARRPTRASITCRPARTPVAGSPKTRRKTERLGSPGEANGIRLLLPWLSRVPRPRTTHAHRPSADRALRPPPRARSRALVRGHAAPRPAQVGARLAPAPRSRAHLLPRPPHLVRAQTATSHGGPPTSAARYACGRVARRPPDAIDRARPFWSRALRRRGGAANPREWARAASKSLTARALVCGNAHL